MAGTGDERPDGAGDEATGTPLIEGRHATYLELFLDLVFVFAVTQVAAVLAGDLSWPGVGRGLLLAWLVWWLWSQFTWLGTAIDLGARSLVPYLVLLAVPPALMMAVAIPDAYDGTGRQFAAAYLVVNLWSLTIQGRDAWSRPGTRAAWLRYVPLAAAAPLALLAGSFLDGDGRVAVWAAVALLGVASALAAGRGGDDAEWRIDPTHFAERHGLFVIISLGEVLVAVGAAAAGLDPTSTVGLALVVTVGVACVLWWAYFAYVPGVVEHRLASAAAPDRGRVARDLFTFGHFPIVFGLVLYAVAAKHVVAHPFDVLAAADRWALAGAIALFVGGLAGLQWQTVRNLSRERTTTVLLVAALCALAGPHVDGVVLVALVGLVVAPQQAHTYRSFVRASMAS
ncbi:MAG: low temperature requirement protein A [Acidimicrobiales bacterium]|nr:low temperature requirement protein A [Acidimicrobiales bacterium]MCB1017196.1 low temperature requirement protein A [Acidimicrobiales bacterium]